MPQHTAKDEPAAEAGGASMNEAAGGEPQRRGPMQLPGCGFVRGTGHTTNAAWLVYERRRAAVA
jgi:hypothetical protein